jgi:predicted O-linked N-acetylglucosamine transferase (SPINDLY family)
MATVTQLLNLAVQHHQQNQLAQAESLYRQILAQDRHHADALHLLGVLFSQRGEFKEGVRFIKKAIKKNNRSATFYSNLGAALLQLKKYKEVIPACRQAIALNPNHAETYNNLGLAFKELSQLKEAMANYQKALTINPNFADVYSNLGELFREQGQLDGAIANYQRALTINPQLAKTYHNLGMALKDQNKLNEASASYQQALALDPNYAKAYFNLGCVRIVQRELEKAVDCFLQAIALKADYVEAYTYLTSILFELGRLDETIAYCQKVLTLEPKCVDAYVTLGGTFFLLGQFEQVIRHYKKALEIQPNNPQAHSGLLMAMHYSLDYDVSTMFAEHLRFAKRHANPLKKFIKPHPNLKNPTRRLKIGYVSPDFRYHSTIFFMEPVLAAHDKTQFEVFIYADVLNPDVATERLQKYADKWHDIVKWSDEQVTEQIRTDQIDVLIDLAGHSNKNRLLVFARQAAPVQVSYLGYMGTTGLTTMNYRLTDHILDPVGETEGYHTEELVRLPVYRIVDFSLDKSPAVNALPALENGYITFASFNNFSKVTPYIIGIWAQILTALPTAHLLIVVKDAEKETVQQQVKNLFLKHDIASERLEIVGTRPFYQYFKLHNQADIGLDPFPHMGGTTTFISLWMGIPVITLSGPKPASRGGSPLVTLGLEDFIAKTSEEYVDIARRMANNVNKLNELRMGLREQMLHSPLMDADGFTRSVEIAYRQMWQKWCAK